MTEHAATTAFVDAYAQGLLCLHPTDTLLGLTSRSCAALTAYKQRPPQQGYVHLAADCAAACRAWQPLPAGWQTRLCKIWPAPLTVVWQAADETQAGTEDGMLAIRVPCLSQAWFAACLHLLQLMPSTSVNMHGEPPLSLAAALARGRDDARLHVPAPLQHARPDLPAALPSTLIKLHPEGTWTLLRRGAYAVSALPRA